MSASNPLERAVDVLLALSGNSYHGLPNVAVAKATGDTEPNTIRTLTRLADVGLVERVPTNERHWRLSARLVQIAVAHHAEMLREQQHLNDFNNRYTRTPV